MKRRTRMYTHTHARTHARTHTPVSSAFPRCFFDLSLDVQEGDMKAMSLGLAHSLSRYKLKFSPDKVDTMIVQAIALLDDLDKELNTYAMRVREWYGWHFPELRFVIMCVLRWGRARQ